MLQEIETVKTQIAFYGELVAEELEAGVRNLYIEMLGAATEKYFALKATSEQLWQMELAR
jgi:hypothetical protein